MKSRHWRDRSTGSRWQSSERKAGCYTELQGFCPSPAQRASGVFASGDQYRPLRHDPEWRRWNVFSMPGEVCPHVFRIRNRTDRAKFSEIHAYASVMAASACRYTRCRMCPPYWFRGKPDASRGPDRERMFPGPVASSCASRQGRFINATRGRVKQSAYTWPWPQNQASFCGLADTVMFGRQGPDRISSICS